MPSSKANKIVFKLRDMATQSQKEQNSKELNS